MNIVIPVRPMPCPRPRVCGHAYMPDKYRKYQNEIAAYLDLSIGFPYEELFLFCQFIFKHSKKQGYHNGTPDLDNLVKGIMDTLQWLYGFDDKKICVVRAEKHFSDFDAIAIDLSPPLESPLLPFQLTPFRRLSEADYALGPLSSPHALE
jgi:Holliday junction resolvase RusA-like endonuclease